MSEIDNTKVVSKYFSIYFSTKNEYKKKSAFLAFLLALMVIIIPLVLSFISKDNIKILNIVYPLTFYGLLSNIAMLKELDNNINLKNTAELNMNWKRIIKKVLKIAKLDTFLINTSIYLGIIELVYAENIIVFTFILIITILEILILNYNFKYKDVHRNSNIKIELILGIIICFLSVFVKNKNEVILVIPSIYIFIFSAIFGILGFYKANNLYSKIFAKECDIKNGYNKMIKNYNVIKKVDKQIEDKNRPLTEYEKHIREMKSDRKRQEATAQRIADIITYRELKKENDMKNYGYKNDSDLKTSGYSTNCTNTETNDRFDAQNKR